MRQVALRFVLILAVGVPLWAASSSVSMPAFWRYAHPEAKALVGIEWNRILNSPLGVELRKKIVESGGQEQVPVEILDQVNRVFVSTPGKPSEAQPGDTPPAVVAIQGTFNLDQIHELAAKESATPSSYGGVEILEHVGDDGKPTAVAVVNSGLLLAGDLASIQGAIDHYNAADPGQASNPLFLRASQLANGNDIWLVAHVSPSDFSNGGMSQAQFLRDVESLEAGISLQSGLGLEINMGTGSPASATELASGLQMLLGMMLAGQQQQNPNAPNLAEKLHITSNDTFVQLALHLDQSEMESTFGQLASSIPGGIGGGGTAPAATPPAQGAGAEWSGWQQAPPPPADRVEPDTGKRMVKIYGLEDGTREVELNR